jgi:hypothetical protein
MASPAFPKKHRSALKKTRLAYLREGEVAEAFELLRLSGKVVSYAPRGYSRWRE